VNSKQLPRFKEDARALLESLGPLPEPQKRPAFIALSGLPGTGKTTFAKELSQQVPVVVLESDALRKVLFPQPTYSWRESDRLFRACYYLIEELLKRGNSVLFDATNLTERLRRTLFDISMRRGLKFILIQMKAPPEIVKQRLEERMQHPTGYSDADWEVYQLMKKRVERIRLRHFVVDTTRKIKSQVKKIVREAIKEKEL
jgi:predicted kinase